MPREGVHDPEPASADGGRKPDGEGDATASPAATTQVRPLTKSGGNRPPVDSLTNGKRPAAAAMPRPAPSPIRSRASASTRAVTLPSEKPSVLRIASSGMRSRIDCAMVLPVRSRSVKNTAARIRATSAPTSPICLAKPMANSFSGCVFVSSGEFAKRRSISAAMARAPAGSATRSIYQPVLPLPVRRASSK